LHVEIVRRGSLEHEGQDHFDEQDRLEFGFGSHGLGQPRFDVPFTDIGDDVAFAIGPQAGFGRTGDHLAIAGKTGEGGIDLPEGKGPFPAEVGVEVTFEVVAVARFPMEQPEDGQRHAHRGRIRSAHTLSQYEAVAAMGAPVSPAGGTTTRVTPEETETNTSAVVRRPVRGHGVDLAVTELGDRLRPTVVLIHGFPDTSAVWAPVAQLLAAGGFHVVAYDVRGAGDSGVPNEQSDYALPVLIEDLAAVITEVSPDAPVHLVGHDWGSIQGWEAVTSGLLTGRIASFTSISGPPLEHAALWARRHRTRRLSDLRIATRQAAHSWYIALFHLPLLPELVTAGVRIGHTASAALRRWGRSPDEPQHRSTLGEDFAHGLKLYRANVRQRFRHPTMGYTETPVQLVVPMADRYVTPPLLDGLENWSSLVWRRESVAGHWIIRTHPDQVAQWVHEVIAFVEGGSETDDLSRSRIQGQTR
jgi:pimeloyl-ACP methyl ester carboxylesterase